MMSTTTHHLSFLTLLNLLDVPPLVSSERSDFSPPSAAVIDNNDDAIVVAAASATISIVPSLSSSSSQLHYRSGSSSSSSRRRLSNRPRGIVIVASAASSSSSSSSTPGIDSNNNNDVQTFDADSTNPSSMSGTFSAVTSKPSPSSHSNKNMKRRRNSEQQRTGQEGGKLTDRETTWKNKFFPHTQARITKVTYSFHLMHPGVITPKAAGMNIGDVVAQVKITMPEGCSPDPEAQEIIWNPPPTDDVPTAAVVSWSVNSEGDAAAQEAALYTGRCEEGYSITPTLMDAVDVSRKIPVTIEYEHSYTTSSVNRYWHILPVGGSGDADEGGNQVVNQAEDWYEAHHRCVELQTSLCSPKEDAEWDRFKEASQAQDGGIDAVWLGAYRFANHSSFLWMDDIEWDWSGSPAQAAANVYAVKAAREDFAKAIAAKEVALEADGNGRTLFQKDAASKDEEPRFIMSGSPFTPVQTKLNEMMGTTAEATASTNRMCTDATCNADWLSTAPGSTSPAWDDGELLTTSPPAVEPNHQKGFGFMFKVSEPSEVKDALAGRDSSVGGSQYELFDAPSHYCCHGSPVITHTATLDIVWGTSETVGPVATSNPCGPGFVVKPKPTPTADSEGEVSAVAEGEEEDVECIEAPADADASSNLPPTGLIAGLAVLCVVLFIGAIALARFRARRANEQEAAKEKEKKRKSRREARAARRASRQEAVAALQQEQQQQHQQQQSQQPVDFGAVEPQSTEHQRNARERSTTTAIPVPSTRRNDNAGGADAAAAADTRYTTNNSHNTGSNNSIATTTSTATSGSANLPTTNKKRKKAKNNSVLQQTAVPPAAAVPVPGVLLLDGQHSHNQNPLNLIPSPAGTGTGAGVRGVRADNNNNNTTNNINNPFAVVDMTDILTMQPVDHHPSHGSPTRGGRRGRGGPEDDDDHDPVVAPVDL